MNNTICTRCIMDTTAPNICFDTEGICNYCKTHDALDKSFPINGNHIKIINKIKQRGKNKKYDCIIGLSGGRDSTYILYLTKLFGLRPLAVHFNDGFGNPIAGKNIQKAINISDTDLRTITSDWRESKDIKIAPLKASVPDLEIGTDLGIAAALYSVSTKENIKYIITGTSFRTEGIAPLEWLYLDGKYLKSIHKKYGTVKLRKWKPHDAGFNLDLIHMIYYTLIKKIEMVPLLYHVNYVRKDAEKIIKKEYDWIDTGAHYFDDLYQSLMAFVLRTKFNIDFRKFNYSALVRSDQMTRDEAIKRIKKIYIVEDPKIIDLCIKRLGITHDELKNFLKKNPKNFRDYSTNYKLIKLFKYPIKIFSHLNIFHPSTYYKFFDSN